MKIIKLAIIVNWLKIDWGAVGILVLIAAGTLFLFLPKDDNQQSSKDLSSSVESEAEREKFEAGKDELSAICTKPVLQVSGIEMAMCESFKENYLFYEFLLLVPNQSDFSYLPEFCKRSTAELTAYELADCPKGDYNEEPFNQNLGSV